MNLWKSKQDPGESLPPTCPPPPFPGPTQPTKLTVAPASLVTPPWIQPFCLVLPQSPRTSLLILSLALAQITHPGCLRLKALPLPTKPFRTLSPSLLDIPACLSTALKQKWSGPRVGCPAESNLPTHTPPLPAPRPYVDARLQMGGCPGQATCLPCFTPGLRPRASTLALRGGLPWKGLHFL